MRSIAANVLTILIVLGVALLGVIGYAERLVSGPGPATEVVSLTVERGEAFNSVTDKLAAAGAIGDPVLFRLAARYSGAANTLKFGEYEFEPGTSMQDIMDQLSRGGNVSYAVTIPPGMTSYQAWSRINAQGPLTGTIEVPAEGSLLPETWAYERGTTRAALVTRMQAAMDAILTDAWENRAPDLPLASKAELLILASIIEKETTAAEHRKVASVFVNRINRGMKLQTDPTVIYGITEGKAPLGRGLRRSELDRATPYNTYVIQGLPPGPIANPSEASIRAAANPDETPYFFFVADGTGGHAFAETLAEHNRNVREWRRIERERQSSNQ